MSFNSPEFALFFPIFLLIYIGVYERTSVRDWLLLTGSYIFYMFWYWQYAGLILLSTIVDFSVGRAMSRSTNKRHRKALLLISLTLNLGLLCIFKYFDFFAASTASVLQSIGINADTLQLELVLPVGISFYTFQTLSYTIDLYRGKIQPERTLVKFAAYVAFFPQLVAGPIVRASHFLPQLNAITIIGKENITAGLRLIFIGLFKKIVIADLLAYLIVDDVFSNPSAFTSVDLAVAIYAYAFQIYCDFSGYSDIAIGIAIMLGFQLPINFNKPYLATSPSDFWRRWHISLSEWLRDYLYIPLGGSRHGALRANLSLIVTMLLGGLWHGAAWNFVIWGGYHGLLLAFTRNWKSVAADTPYYKRAFFIFITFHAILLGWLLFRVSDISHFQIYTSGLSEMTAGTEISSLGFFVLITAVIMHVLPADSLTVIERLIPARVRTTMVSGFQAALMLLFIGVSVGGPSFIYFQF